MNDQSQPVAITQSGLDVVTVMGVLDVLIVFAQQRFPNEPRIIDVLLTARAEMKRALLGEDR